ncbi:Gfo/Idh/MocA family oxidoreductase [Streptomyces sp. NPDC097610]|uniref:Gfo/Idh/MocA family protein n=1 Tax=Streptomyces sp. NPDC097610 TaxID=3157227 RepID=UPI003317C82E
MSAAASPTPTASISEPSRPPVGVGIIGLSARGGWAARAHVPALEALSDKFELRALSASSVESAHAAGAKYGVPLAFGTADDLVSRDEVDLVVVTVKVPHHRELVEAALRAGKNVLCEWPLANGLTEAETLADLATSAGVRAFTGLQARANPALRYLRDLVAQGYVGEVLSTSMIASGATWGATYSPGGEYLLDRENGATMLTIPFGHTIDVLSMVLGQFTEVTSTTAVRRPRVINPETGVSAAMTAADQVAVTGVLDSGAVAAVHYRGGTSRGTGFHWEINGTEGDLVVTAPSGHLQLAPVTLLGARGAATVLTELTVPAAYEEVPALAGHSDQPSYAVAHAYAALFEDLVKGTHTVPDFPHAVRHHRFLDGVERAAATGRRIHTGR